MHTRFRIFPVSPATNSSSLLDASRHAVHREDSMCTHYVKHTYHCVLNPQRGLGGAGDFAVTRGYIPQLFPRIGSSSSLSVLQGKDFTQVTPPYAVSIGRTTGLVETLAHACPDVCLVDIRSLLPLGVPIRSFA